MKTNFKLFNIEVQAKLEIKGTGRFYWRVERCDGFEGNVLLGSGWARTAHTASKRAFAAAEFVSIGSNRDVFYTVIFNDNTKKIVDESFWYQELTIKSRRVKSKK